MTTNACVAAVTLFAVAAAPALAQDEPEHPFIEREGNAERYVLRFDYGIRGQQESTSDRVAFIEYDLDTLAIIFPAGAPTSSSDCDPRAVTGEFQINDGLRDDEPTILDPYAAGAFYARWDTGRVVRGRSFELQLEIPVTSYNTILKPQAAAAGWPVDELPPEARTALGPQFLIDQAPRDRAAVQRLVRDWTGGNDPKSIPPLQLAKYFLGKTIDLVQITGQNVTFGSSVLGFVGIEGLDMQGVAETVRRGRGTELDITGLYCAALREAGLPARMVYSIEDLEENEDRRSGLDDAAEIRAHVEFYLHDQATRTGGWIPADPARLREMSSRAPNLDRDWPFFGTHDELEYRAPFAFHAHPPTSVRAYGAPAFWGWIGTPGTPAAAIQGFTFDIRSASVRRDDAERRRDRR